MIKSMIFLIVIFLFLAFIYITKKHSLRVGKNIQKTIKEMFIAEREKK